MKNVTPFSLAAPYRREAAYPVYADKRIVAVAGVSIRGEGEILADTQSR